MYYINLFQTSVPSLYPLKIFENLWFSDVSKEHRNKTLTWNGLTNSYPGSQNFQKKVKLSQKLFMLLCDSTAFYQCALYNVDKKIFATFRKFFVTFRVMGDVDNPLWCVARFVIICTIQKTWKTFLAWPT